MPPTSGTRISHVSARLLPYPPTYFIITIVLILILILTAIGLSPGGSGYFTCVQNMKMVANKFKSGGLHEKHVVATWNVGNRLSVCL